MVWVLSGSLIQEGGLSTELGYGVGALGTGLDFAQHMAASGHFNELGSRCIIIS